MFGLNFTNIIVIGLVIAGAFGYMVYSQKERDELNQQLAANKFALEQSQATIAKQKADLEQAAKILEETNKQMQEARLQVDKLHDKFSKQGRDFGKFVDSQPDKAEDKVNAASKKSWRCIEETINKGEHNGDC
jgi:septal ring factor EnvC (AmiA/AmiB activator)